MTLYRYGVSGPTSSIAIVLGSDREHVGILAIPFDESAALARVGLERADRGIDVGLFDLPGVG
jgi:hypothetical protein